MKLKALHFTLVGLLTVASCATPPASQVSNQSEPSPSPLASPEPTPSPTASPSASPTPSPTPTPKPTPTPDNRPNIEKVFGVRFFGEAALGSNITPVFYDEDRRRLKWDWEGKVVVTYKIYSTANNWALTSGTREFTATNQTFLAEGDADALHELLKDTDALAITYEVKLPNGKVLSGTFEKVFDIDDLSSRIPALPQPKPSRTPVPEDDEEDENENSTTPDDEEDEDEDEEEEDDTPSASPTPRPTATPAGTIPALFAPPAGKKCKVNFTINWLEEDEVEFNYYSSSSYLYEDDDGNYYISVTGSDGSLLSLVLHNISTGNQALSKEGWEDDGAHLRFYNDDLTPDGSANSFSNSDSLVAVSVKGNVDGNIWGNFGGNIYSGDVEYNIVGLFGCSRP